MGALKRRILDGLSAGLEWSGAAAVYARRADAQGAVVLLYHSVPTPELAPWIDPANAIAPAMFEAQMRFVARRRRPVAMDALVDALERGEPLAPGTVAITFDDGYLDNLLVAAPILEKLGLPATLYLPTGLVSRAESQWIDRLHAMFTTRTRDKVAMTGDGARRWRLGEPHEGAAARAAFAKRLLGAGREEREEMFADLAGQLRPQGVPPRLTMGWEDVRALLARYPNISIGAHTVEHADLSACSEREAEGEIARSVTEARDGAGAAPEHFSFPYGRSTGPTREAVRRLGLRSAVASADDPKVRSTTSPLHIPRIVTDCPSALFRYRTGGAWPDLSRKLFAGRA